MNGIQSAKNQIFITIIDNVKISTAINTITTTYDFNAKVKMYLSYQAQIFLQTYYYGFQVKGFEIYTFSYLPRWYFLMLTTNPNTNHPFLLFANLDDNKIHVIRPIGREHGQVEIPIVFEAVAQCNAIEKFALYFAVDRSIFMRKNAIVYVPQFTLINCNNITNCMRKMHEIDKMNISKSEKLKQVAKYEEFYKNKAIEFLQYYFTLLENANYDEAYLFLKGNHATYYKKERLNTFFKDTKIIVGHLHIFIELYRLVNYLKFFANLS